MSQYYVGIDLGGTNIKIGLLDERGQIIAQDDEPTHVELGPDSVVERTVRRIEQLVQKTGLARRDLRAGGMCSPGPLLLEEGKIIRACNLPGFDQFNFRAKFSRALNLPMIMEHDAAAACWGEYWCGAGQGTKNIVLFTLGTGIGGGVIYGGEVFRAGGGNHPELGHMIIKLGGRQCTCGQRGCLETYASATHTAARAQDALKEGRESSLQPIFKKQGSVSCKDVFDHAKAGDPLADEIVDGTAEALAQACIIMLHSIEPQRVILMGGMVKAGEMLAERVRKFYQGMLWFLKEETMEICLAKLGSDAGFIGAAGIAMHDAQHHRLRPIGT